MICEMKFLSRLKMFQCNVGLRGRSYVLCEQNPRAIAQRLPCIIRKSICESKMAVAQILQSLRNFGVVHA